MDQKFIDEDLHSKPGCIACHGGTPGTMDKNQAHEGLAEKVGAEPQKACGSCHVGTVAQARESQHRMQWGYHEVLRERGLDFTMPEAVTAYTSHCTSCHADCSDCHISRPTIQGGGLISGHQVKRVANVNLTCSGCHGARVSDEYKGKHEGIPADVHWEKLGMPCTTCHTVEEYHGGQHGTRYDGAPSPSCTDGGCHDDGIPGGGIQHVIHQERLACQVCHAAGEYKSCFNCHTARDDDDLPYFITEATEMTFKIGRNPLQSEDRPWDYVLLRHVPANKDLFAFYGEGLLPDFDNVPTWKYTTTHNIRRITPQNETCDNCHGQTSLFLTKFDVAPQERAANSSVIVEKVPPARGGGVQ